ncbi:hypothetical protein EDB69_0683 [Vibrio crassostreae]|uniref:hypothetical protein n=1 Tax=Vibrio TaxID=662 RepID=UPI0006352B67|nr:MULTISPECIES: hypothetical protein [Vibrio]ROO76029.1 hypothetical protein EDB64_1013 [Vibrio crassostreae]ROP14038.1 hypothetical protein EDB63_1045 [Vibrio crassostreae]ROQ88124.1 hypothetical protein EDB72_1680 [Vibrio crassostreae]RPE94727.1 hypothetical protein EDB68_0760 [Vibrio crassostreae]RPF06193.1 hypothetical protein EDB17_0654 [Vibrio crassostreae]
MVLMDKLQKLREADIVSERILALVEEAIVNGATSKEQIKEHLEATLGSDPNRELDAAQLATIIEIILQYL